MRGDQDGFAARRGAGERVWDLGAVLARRPRGEDLEDYERILLDPRVREWLRPAPLEPMSEADVLGLLGADSRHWDDYGYGAWSLLEPGSGRVIGRGGLNRTRVGRRTEVELPWALLPECWGRGIATTAARGAIEWAREIGLSRVIALIRPQNAASIAVAERAGMAATATTTHAGLPHLVYSTEP